jgi:hypothetical protein
LDPARFAQSEQAPQHRIHAFADRGREDLVELLLQPQLQPWIGR